MAENNGSDGNLTSSIEDGDGVNSKTSHFFGKAPYVQKMIAEVLGTYFLVFAGCASVMVNLSKDNVVTLPGIAMVWGLAVLVMVYSIGHISGAHFNPAVTIAFATCRRFTWKQVPGYILAQFLGSLLASITLRLLFGWDKQHFPVTTPSGSSVQSLVLEFIITFYLMFVISGVATDDKAIGELAGLAIGSTILMNVLLSGAISGGSMNPTRSLGPAIAFNHYDGIWIYIVGPTCGAIAGAHAYNSIRSSKKLAIIETSASNPLFKS